MELKLELINVDAVQYRAVASERWRSCWERSAAAGNWTQTSSGSET